MDQLLLSCANAEKFPIGGSLVGPSTNEDTLQALFMQLEDRKDVLFLKDDNRAALHFLETDDLATDPAQSLWRSKCVGSFNELKRHLRIEPVLTAAEPLCRFIFVCAPHSRARLFTSSRMFMLSLTYHQALPVFLDFIFPFGLQQYPHDPYFSGFRSEDRFSEAVRGVPIHELGRSGRDIRLCYSLKSAERTRPDSAEKWSIRQTSIYHSFDIESGHATWIVVKGDDLIKRRLDKAITSPECSNNIRSNSVDRMFASIFAVHRVLCDWAGENWRWYLNDLEEQVQSESRQASSVLVNNSDLEQIDRPLLRSDTYGDRSQPRTQNSRGNVHITTQQVGPRPCPPSGPSQHVPEIPPKPIATDVFNLKHLQKVQYIQDQAGQALLILESNANVIAEMRECYKSIMNSEGWPEKLKEKCAGDVERFDKCAGTAERHLRLQYLRAQTLRSLLEGRKAMLHGILDSRRQSQAQQSAINMERMSVEMQEVTSEMHEIARKTQRETVSMRIITLVTLFFLPGTFIAGFMNTNIVQWKDDDPTGQVQSTFTWPALKFFLFTVGPLTFITFCLWYAFYWWAKRKEKMATQQGRINSDMSTVGKTRNP